VRGAATHLAERERGHLLERELVLGRVLCIRQVRTLPPDHLRLGRLDGPLGALSADALCAVVVAPHVAAFDLQPPEALERVHFERVILLQILLQILRLQIQVLEIGPALPPLHLFLQHLLLQH
jgi:hypothetical protein